MATMTPAIRVRAVALAMAFAGLDIGQARGAPPPPPPEPSLSVARTSAAIDGEVARYLVTPYGDPNGLRLADGTLVLFAPHLGSRLAAVIAPGDRVRVIGQAAADGAMRAVSLVNLSTGATLDDAPAGPPPAAPTPRAPLQRLEAAGTIDAILRGPRGEANGVILTDGSVIYFRPDLVRTAPARGQPFAAIGIGTRGPGGASGTSGTALEAIVTGTDLATMRTSVSASGKSGMRPAPPGAPNPPASAPPLPPN